MTEAAASIASRLGLRRIGREWRGTCPACGYKLGLTLSEKSGRALWWCASCRDQEAVTAAILGDAAAVAPRESSPPPDKADKIAAALRLWDAAMPAEGSPVAAYLAGRGLALPPAVPLRFLPLAKHPSGRRLPCMLALLRDAEGRPVAVHRTFLHVGAGAVTKAAIEPVRMTLGNVRGAAVRLWPVAPRLVVAEGIETSLAAATLLRLPAWAAVSAGNLGEALALPPAVKDVIVAADNDAPGREAARQAARRWKAEGRAVRIAMPEREGADFNDVLRERRA